VGGGQEGVCVGDGVKGVSGTWGGQCQQSSTHDSHVGADIEMGAAHTACSEHSCQQPLQQC
jgi:hypothetical protein